MNGMRQPFDGGGLVPVTRGDPPRLVCVWNDPPPFGPELMVQLSLAERDQLRARIAELESRIVELKADYEQLERQLGVARRHRSDLLALHDEVEADRDRLRDERDRLRARKEDGA